MTDKKKTPKKEKRDKGELQKVRQTRTSAQLARRRMVAAGAVALGIVGAAALGGQGGGQATAEPRVCSLDTKKAKAFRRELRKERAISRKLRSKLARERKTVSRQSTQVRPAAGGRSALASAYGVGFYGNTTACGQTLTGNSNLVAHKTLPCGTPLTVSANGRSVRTKVGDRGPYSGGREFDLGPGVWRALGFSSEYAFGVRTVMVR